MEKAKKYIKDNRYRSYVGDVKNEDIQIAIKIAYLEGAIDACKVGLSISDMKEAQQELQKLLTN